MTTSGSRARDWVADHIRRYQESNGEDGHIWNGVPTLLLTTTGRKKRQVDHHSADLRPAWR